MTSASARVDFECADLGVRVVQLVAETTGQFGGKTQRRGFARTCFQMQIVAMQMQLIGDIRLEMNDHLVAFVNLDHTGARYKSSAAEHEIECVRCGGRSGG